MNALENISRKKLTIAGMVVAAIFLFFVNIWSSLGIQTAQLDLTENNLYTLSQGSKDVIKTIDEPIIFRLYYSPSFGEISPPHGNYFKRVRELLEQFSAVSGGKIDLKIIPMRRTDFTK